MLYVCKNKPLVNIYMSVMCIPWGLHEFVGMHFCNLSVYGGLRRQVCFVCLRTHAHMHMHVFLWASEETCKMRKWKCVYCKSSVVCERLVYARLSISWALAHFCGSVNTPRYERCHKVGHGSLLTPLMQLPRDPLPGRGMQGPDLADTLASNFKPLCCVFKASRRSFTRLASSTCDNIPRETWKASLFAVRRKQSGCLPVTVTDELARGVGGRWGGWDWQVCLKTYCPVRFLSLATMIQYDWQEKWLERMRVALPKAHSLLTVSLHHLLCHCRLWLSGLLIKPRPSDGDRVCMEETAH